MKLSAFITKTRPEQRGDTFQQCYDSARGIFDEVIVIDGEESWPHEFDWPLIGEHFQQGYEQATGDWVVHLDADFIFHEATKDHIRQAFTDYNYSPAMSFYKWQFLLPDRYTLKSRLVLAVNKRNYGNRIKFNSGGDLCQPSLDGIELSPDSVPEARIPFFCYEKLLKTKEQITEDAGRMARAWHRHFGSYKLGGPDDESAYSEWLKMIVGRFDKPAEHIRLGYHPKVMQETIKNLRPDQWGYSGFGNLEVNDYARD